MPQLRLLPISESGCVSDFTGALSETAQAAIDLTKTLHSAIGFNPPWVGYMAVSNNEVVGCSAFKSRPINGRVEIAYFTFPGYEGRGIATSMAAELIGIATSQDESLLITAQTLTERNASHRVLEKLGFTQAGTIEHAEDGMVLEWHLDRKEIVK